MLARMPAKEYKLKHSFHPGSSGFLPFLFWRYLTACLKMHYYSFLGFAGGSGGKESACNAGDPGSILGSGRSPWEGTGNLLQYSCLENAMDRGTWQAIVHGVAKNWTWLSDSHTHTHTHTHFIHFSGTTPPPCAVPHSSPPALTAVLYESWDGGPDLLSGWPPLLLLLFQVMLYERTQKKTVPPPGTAHLLVTWRWPGSIPVPSASM